MCIFLFKDKDEQIQWEDYFSTIEDKKDLIYNNIGELESFIHKSSENIKVFGISSDILDNDCEKIVKTIKNSCPSCEICILLTEPSKNIPFKCLIQNNINHVIIKPNEEEEYIKNFYRERFTLTLKKIAKNEKISIQDYVSPSVTVYCEEINNSEQKEEVIKKLENLIQDGSEDADFFKQRVALVADEMLENALYGAPKKDDGVSIYKKGECRATQKEEKITFYYAYDGKTLTMEISDNWGSLIPNTVLELLEKNNNNEEIDFETPGGRGFFIMSRFFDLFHVIIKPGHETKVGGHLLMNPNFDPMNKKGFHIQVQKN